MKAHIIPGNDQKLVTWLEEDCKPDDPCTSAGIVMGADGTFTF
jgi:hypothetical protein